MDYASTIGLSALGLMTVSHDASEDFGANPGATPGGAPGGAPWAEASGLLARLRGFARLPREQALGRLSYVLKRPVYALRLIRLLPPAIGPAAPRVTPTDPWPGHADSGAAIVGDHWTLAGQLVRQPAPYWSPLGVEPAWVEALHGFAWLRDLRAAGGDAPRRKARALVGDWMDRHDGWSPRVWEPVVTGRRAAHWLGHYDFFAASAEIEFQRRVLEQLARHGRHLLRVLPAGLAGADLIVAIKGLIYAGVCLPDGQDWLRRGRALLGQELPRQILDDGGHVERSPARQLDVLRDLVDLRAVLHAGGIEVPADLQRAIERMAPLLRGLRHGDGGLAQFNGSGEAEGWRVDLVLQRAGGRTRPVMSALSSGYQRLQAGRTLILVDAGPPPPAGLDRAAHAGTLGFEMSVGRERMIVNCGAQPGHAAWRWAQRTTAAHSTLVVNASNSSEVLAGGGLGQRPASVACTREEADGNVWLELSHDGYRRAHGVVHQRRLYLAAAGDDLRGEDRLEAVAEGAPEGVFAVRFHLHPDVRVSLARGGDTALLRLTKGGGWRLRARGGEITLEPSVYLGRDGEQRRSQQIVLRGNFAPPETRVSWALRREAKARSKR